MTIELFCKVVDNYGDAAICGRLARQLASEHEYAIRLWIDKPEVLAELQIALPASVSVQPWPDDFVLPPGFGNVVIEAFSCGTPTSVLAHMKAQPRQPLWLNIEYLSTEAWAAGCNMLPSTHPATGLVQYFIFPGFWPATGGLLREQNLLEQRDAFIKAQPERHELLVSLFCYKSAPIQPLLAALAAHSQKVRLLLPHNLLPELEAGGGNLTIERFTFLPQAEYDHLLWSCDLNFVRGEDSFVRANWAGKPLIWQAYPEERDQQKAKISGFLTRYSEKLVLEAAETLALAHEVWNLPGLDAGSLWLRLLNDLPALTAHAKAWSAELAQQPDLAGQLAGWIEQQRIKS